MVDHMELKRYKIIEVVPNVFALLGQQYNSRLVLDPTYPTIDESSFKY